MIPFKLIGYGVVAATILGVGIYAKHIHKEAQRVPNLVQTINDLHDQREQERQNVKASLEKEREIRLQLDSVTDRSNELARRLRHALRVPANPTPTPDPLGTGGDGGGVSTTDDDVANLLGACQRDAIRLNAWIDYYKSIPAELK